MLGKNGGAVILGNFKRRYKRSPYDSGVLFLPTHSAHVYTLQSTCDALTCSSFRRFL